MHLTSLLLVVGAHLPYIYPCFSPCYLTIFPYVPMIFSLCRVQSFSIVSIVYLHFWKPSSSPVGLAALPMSCRGTQGHTGLAGRIWWVLVVVCGGGVRGVGGLGTGALGHGSWVGHGCGVGLGRLGRLGMGGNGEKNEAFTSTFHGSI